MSSFCKKNAVSQKKKGGVRFMWRNDRNLSYPDPELLLENFHKYKYRSKEQHFF